MPESISNSVEALLTAVADVPLAELPHLLGQLREAEARAMARLYAAPPVSAGSLPEHLLDVEQAAQRLNVSEDYLYRNWKKLPFARKFDFGLRFSESGLNGYIRDGK